MHELTPENTGGTWGQETEAGNESNARKAKAKAQLKAKAMTNGKVSMKSKAKAVSRPNKKKDIEAHKVDWMTDKGMIDTLLTKSPDFDIEQNEVQ